MTALARAEEKRTWEHRGRRNIHHALEAGFGHSLQGSVISGLVIALAIGNVLAGAAFSVADIRASYGGWIRAWRWRWWTSCVARARSSRGARSGT